MPDERIFRDEESLTPDALAADRRGEARLPLYIFALTSSINRFYGSML